MRIWCIEGCGGWRRGEEGLLGIRLVTAIMCDVEPSQLCFALVLKQESNPACNAVRRSHKVE
jgi:hypothetical protein